MLTSCMGTSRAVSTVDSWLSQHPGSMERVIFNVFKDEDKKYYEEIDPEYAEILYKQVAAAYLKDEKYQELADAYAVMKPKKAAAALYEMTGDLDKVVAILQCMTVESRAEILNALSDVDAVFCGKITVLLAP